MEIFETCYLINDKFNSGDESGARNLLIELLDYHEREGLLYSSCVNSLVRMAGLFPYLKFDTANWSDRLAFEAFKVDVGGNLIAPLHIEQSDVLRLLLDGKNVALSAPTSFGKSFIIDAFIAMKRPRNVVIIVPTLALTDEIRRRVYRKFSLDYRIITSSDSMLGESNILIFPQERAMAYVDKLKSIDLLVVDEFYKVSRHYDKERSPALFKVILDFSKKSKQRYFLAPNITTIDENVLTKGMLFVNKLDFNTVVLKKHDSYKEIPSEEGKAEYLIAALQGLQSKSLIYAASYPEVFKVARLLSEKMALKDTRLLNAFSDWVSVNYNKNWILTDLIKNGVGIHNGQLHRSLAQIQVRLFEVKNGLDVIISTSSMIEGVNTSAENVFLWKNRKGGRGNPLLDSFTYKNIMGRGGRMFKHFIGNVYILEKPPSETSEQLEIPFPDTILGTLDEVSHKDSLTKEQVRKILTYKEEMARIMGSASYDRIVKEKLLQTQDSTLIMKIAQGMHDNPNEWNGLGFLNSKEPAKWERMISKVINLIPGQWGDGPIGQQHSKFVKFVMQLANNWNHTIPEMMVSMAEINITMEEFFKLERLASYKLASLLSDVGVLYSAVNKDSGVDISSFVGKLSSAFLPPAVYELEEYGLPRMISKKLEADGFLDFEEEINVDMAINRLREFSLEELLTANGLDPFDGYILKYFYAGISHISEMR